MKERPILFSGETVRANLEDRKTQTRRVMKVQPPDEGYILGRMVESTAREDRKNEGKLHWIKVNDSRIITSDKTFFTCPYGQIGDRLWVRETCCIAPKKWAKPDNTCIKDTDGDLRYIGYKANGHFEDAMRDYGLKWTPSIFMPRWASRINLEITNIRVERLQDISIKDALAEGIIGVTKDNEVVKYCVLDKGDHSSTAWADMPRSPIEAYKNLWESINGSGSWDLNPWVWVIEYRRI